MNTDTPSVEGKPEDRLDVARTVYKSLVAQYPDRLIVLCNDRGLMLAHTDGNRDVATGSPLSEE